MTRKLVRLAKSSREKASFSPGCLTCYASSDEDQTDRDAPAASSAQAPAPPGVTAWSDPADEQAVRQLIDAEISQRRSPWSARSWLEKTPCVLLLTLGRSWSIDSLRDGARGPREQLHRNGRSEHELLDGLVHREIMITRQGGTHLVGYTHPQLLVCRRELKRGLRPSVTFRNGSNRGSFRLRLVFVCGEKESLI